MCVQKEFQISEKMKSFQTQMGGGCQCSDTIGRCRRTKVHILLARSKVLRPACFAA